jgi:hypothetical protein
MTANKRRVTSSFFDVHQMAKEKANTAPAPPPKTKKFDKSSKQGIF